MLSSHLSGCRLIILFGLHGVGKTTTVLCLAEKFAEQGIKVCVMQADFYKSSQPFTKLQRFSNIDVISGLNDKNLCYHIRFERLFDLIDIDKYGVIIIDTPGCWRDRRNIANMFDLPLKFLKSINIDKKIYAIVERLNDEENSNIYKEYREAISEINCEIITHDDIFDIKMI